MSILGQPPSETAEPATHDELQILSNARGNDILSSDDSVTFAANVIERTCGGFLGDDDPYSLILGEKIDEKDEHLMNG